LGSTRAGEGADDGAMVAPPPQLLGHCSVLAALREERAAKTERRERSRQSK
jgi:hypothetical protein